jgi:membrane protein DedA with SNARE-associated domain
MPETLAALLARYGYAVVFAGVFLENLGVPVPGETALLAAGVLAQRGTFSLPRVIGLGIAAAILGDNLGYWIGRRRGRRLAERHGRLVGLTPVRLASLDAFFVRHGARMVFFARFVSGLRVLAPLFAGMSGLPWPRFLLYNAAGALVWTTAVGSVGYLFGQSWGLLERWVGRIGLLGAGLVIALALIALARRS